MRVASTLVSAWLGRIKNASCASWRESLEIRKGTHVYAISCEPRISDILSTIQSSSVSSSFEVDQCFICTQAFINKYQSQLISRVQVHIDYILRTTIGVAHIGIPRWGGFSYYIAAWFDALKGKSSV